MSVSSRTPLRGNHRPTQSLSLPFAVVAALHPKRTRNRTSILALLALISLAAFVFCSYFPITLAPTYLLRASDRSPVEQVVLAQQQQRGPSKPKKLHKQLSLGSKRQPISLNLAQELAAVSSFLASLAQNVIPSSVDPARPLDPELVLDFDTRSPTALEEVERVVEYVWTQNPVMIYCKHYSPLSRELKAMLHDLNLRPPPFVIDVDMRDDAEVLTPLLARLAGTNELPLLLVGGKPMGSMDDIRIAYEEGKLQRQISAAGGVIGGGGKRKKHHH
ncbi:Glutaredoxin domain-containing protein [Mycena indigotica]|uniref:Glutaredoxin domain-containing protein n=1 Tax=Mycena indigotica TaxID=2126181 RepID=A0A8H6WIA1_9AGAR|nr:Glutaredoxin domain-containing protein [Mycena indigotica]KAF7315903.1 Glutaredoxin domain-containing protein [Mycena indigotica]